MIDIQNALDNLQEFLLENRKKTIIVCGALIFLMFCACIAILMHDTKSKKKDSGTRPLVIDQPLMVPASPVIPDGYITTRKTEKNWSEEEIEKWFTLPDETEVEQLSETNDRIIQDIIGAAP